MSWWAGSTSGLLRPPLSAVTLRSDSWVGGDWTLRLARVHSGEFRATISARASSPRCRPTTLSERVWSSISSCRGRNFFSQFQVPEPARETGSLGGSRKFFLFCDGRGCVASKPLPRGISCISFHSRRDMVRSGRLSRQCGLAWALRLVRRPPDIVTPAAGGVAVVRFRVLRLQAWLVEPGTGTARFRCRCAPSYLRRG